jgi:hypothetical protein
MPALFPLRLPLYAKLPNPSEHHPVGRAHVHTLARAYPIPEDQARFSNDTRIYLSIPTASYTSDHVADRSLICYSIPNIILRTVPDNQSAIMTGIDISLLHPSILPRPPLSSTFCQPCHRPQLISLIWLDILTNICSSSDIAGGGESTTLAADKSCPLAPCLFI